MHAIAGVVLSHSPPHHANVMGSVNTLYCNCLCHHASCHSLSRHAYMVEAEISPKWDWSIKLIVECVTLDSWLSGPEMFDDVILKHALHHDTSH